MKKTKSQKNWLWLSISVLILSIAAYPILSTRPALAISNLDDFDNTSDLTTKFNHDGSPQFSNLSSSGINNTGSVNVPNGSNDLWVTKQGYSVSGAADSVYTFSAYFLVSQNSGYGNLGFTNATSATGDSYGQPSTGIGVNFHGGGGGFFNNGSQTALSWPPDLVLGNWYWFKFVVTTKGSNQFDLKLQIYNTDSTGTIGTMKTEKTQNNITNNTMGSAPVIRAFFGAAGSRMSKIDNFAMDLAGSTFVESGTPVVLSGSTSGVTTNSASFGGNVTSDQGSTVTGRGYCWSTSANPTVGGSCYAHGSGGTGTFTGSATGLSPSTTYHIRAYATNVNGTSYGSDVSFTTATPTYDSDGIDNAIEAGGPNSGDANGDGTADNTQPKVASLENSITGKYSVVETENCDGVENVAITSMSSSHPDDKYTYPLGLANFEAFCSGSPGGTVNLVQYFYGDYDVSKYELRKYNSITHAYSKIDSAQFSNVTIGGQPAMKIAYSIVDGGPNDEDGIANNRVVDPAGPALLSSTVNAPHTGVQPAPFFQIVAGFITLLILSLFSNGLISRRSRKTN